MIRSALFVPADRTERVDKALMSAADLVIADLEDAVADRDKDMARDAIRTRLDEAGADPRLAVRINALTTPAGIRDLAALADRPPACVLLPKCESVRDIAILRASLGPDTSILPLIETAMGLAECRAVAMAGVAGVMLGGVDLAAELGLEPGWEALRTARGLIVLACAAAGVPAIDAPFIAIDDVTALAVEAMAARAIGFSAKAAIHPRQLEAINATWTPSAAELLFAREALDAYLAAGERAIRHAGRMIDAPVARALRRTLARTPAHR
ncbi:MAG: CoA ester lyase [Candidatus Sphingomonas phytovorans]|nr:CoA ester lyase [Sphingomonas sp.]WEK02225.1 MAG: CoA ester lyase [Sphingomonas sp.]